VLNRQSHKTILSTFDHLGLFCSL